METSEPSRRLADTQEFLAVWSAAKEEHFVQELVPLLPLLFGSPEKLDGKQTEAAARHLVRALHLAATAEGDVHTAMDYLTKVVEGKSPADLE